MPEPEAERASRRVRDARSRQAGQDQGEPGDMPELAFPEAFPQQQKTEFGNGPGHDAVIYVPDMFACKSHREKFFGHPVTRLAASRLAPSPS